jgi:hypothetical protein
VGLVHTERMTRLEVSQVVRVAPVVALFLALPSLAGALAPGLPERPTVADYARCSLRSFLVTPKPPARAKALPKGVEARTGAPRVGSASRG